jgi:hypothetical protein
MTGLFLCQKKELDIWFKVRHFLWSMKERFIIQIQEIYLDYSRSSFHTLNQTAVPD